MDDSSSEHSSDDLYEEEDYTEEDFTLFEMCDNELFDQALSKLSSSSSSSSSAAQLAKEVFDRKFDSTALHVTLYGRGPRALVDAIVEASRADRYKRNVLALKDGSLNLPLHVAATVGCDEDTVCHLARHHPSALLQRNDANRTPLDLAKRYFSPVLPMRRRLEALTSSYTCYLAQLTIHLHARRLFVSSNEEARPGKVKSKKRCLRALHVLGYFMTREVGVFRHILSFAGSVRMKPKRPSKKRKKPGDGERSPEAAK